MKLKLRFVSTACQTKNSFEHKSICTYSVTIYLVVLQLSHGKYWELYSIVLNVYNVINVIFIFQMFNYARNIHIN